MTSLDETPQAKVQTGATRHATPDPEYPEPTSEDLENPLFNTIWIAIKDWDISRYNDNLYSGPTGNDVMHILNRIK